MTDGRAATRRLDWRECFRLACWAVPLAPAGIVLHELGHFLVGLSLGFPVRLNVGSVSGGPVIGSAPDQAVALQASSGPLVTVVLMVIAAWGLARSAASGWAFALAITAPLRFIVGGIYLFWVVKAWSQDTAFQGTPNFDEVNAVLAIGVSPTWLVAFQMVGLITFWIWTVVHPVSAGALQRVASVLVGAIDRTSDVDGSDRAGHARINRGSFNVHRAPRT